MRDNTKKKKSDMAFIAKIKTLNISTGAHQQSQPFQFLDKLPCPDCGKEMKLIAAGVIELHPIKMPNGNPQNN